VESLQDFATAVKQLSHRAYPTLPEDHIRRETGRAFADWVEDHEIKVALLIGWEKTLNEALRQALELRPYSKPQAPTRLGQDITGEPIASHRPTKERKTFGRLEPWRTVPLREPCANRRKAENDRRWKPEERPSRDTRESPRYEWQAGNEETNRRAGRRSGNEQGPAEKAVAGICIQSPITQ
jgi:hypothetical protein